jgi:hypothetical protein
MMARINAHGGQRAHRPSSRAHRKKLQQKGAAPITTRYGTSSPRRGRRHLAPGGAQRNPGLERAAQYQTPEGWRAMAERIRVDARSSPNVTRPGGRTIVTPDATPSQSAGVNCSPASTRHPTLHELPLTLHKFTLPPATPRPLFPRARSFAPRRPISAQVIH